MFVLGLDFGTTSSCMSYYDKHKDEIVVIPNVQGDLTTPSSICLVPEYRFGESDVHSVTNMKRLHGKTYSEFLSDKDLRSFLDHKNIRVKPDSESKYCSIEFPNFDGIVPVSHLIRRYLQSLLTVAEAYTKRTVTHIVVSVPAYYNDLQRQSMRTIIESLGRAVLRIINEPTAAALAYAHVLKPDCQHETIMVVDCGGGTTDVSVVEMDYAESVFQVLSVAGDNFLGGEDITHNLVSYMKEHCKLNPVALTNKQAHHIFTGCENIKKQLSYSNNASYVVDINDNFYNLSISRAKFLEINKNFFRRITELVERVVITETIDRVVLVGGSTRIPHFKTIVRDAVGEQVTICDSLNPDHTVSIGATVQGSMLQLTEDNITQKNSTMLDITSMTLGIETEGGIMTRVISKNTVIPVSKSMIFTNSRDYVDNIDVNIFQGERMFVEDNFHLGTLHLTGLDKSLKSGEINIHVEFKIDKDGIISVTAKDAKSGTLKSLCVNKFEQKEQIVDLDDIMQDQVDYHLLIAKSSLVSKLSNNIRIFHNIFPDVDKTSFVTLRMNSIFNAVLNVVADFESYTPRQLKHIETKFIDSWHKTMLDRSPHIEIDTEILEIGATKIEC